MSQSDTEVSSTSTVKNLNSGSTLNVVFFRLNNIYESALVLDQLQFVYQASLSLVEGIEVPIVRRYSLSELGKVVAAIAKDPVFETGELLLDQKGIRRYVLRTIMATVLAEYAEPNMLGAGWNTLGSAAAFAAIDESAKKLFLDWAALFIDNASDVRPQSGAFSTYEEELEHATKTLNALVANGAKISEHRLSVPSDAVYADTVVGNSGALDDYSLRMREREVRMRDADIAFRYAEARRTAAGPSSLDSNFLLAVQDDISQQKYYLEVATPIPAGTWNLRQGSDSIARIRVNAPSRRLVAERLGTRQLDSGDATLWLLNSETDQSIKLARTKK